MSSRVLFVSPYFPDAEGNGPARRAHAVLTSLARRHQVSLLFITPRHEDRRVSGGPPPGCVACRHLPSHAGRDTTLRLRRWMAGHFPRFFSIVLRQPPDWIDHTPARLRLAAESYSGESFEIIHAFRMAVAPHVLALHRAMGGRPALHLDTDDIESVTRARLSALHDADGNRKAALRQHLNARAFVHQEKKLFARFDRLFVCSATDAGQLAGTHRDIRVLPNTVVVPECQPAAPPVGECFRFLFIGTLDYFPNRDALQWFCGEILPRLRAACGCELLVAGHSAPSSLKRFLRKCPGVVFLGHVESAASAYMTAHAVIAPLRAGGGTRLKILEAFAQGRPVVSTTLGIEGIASVPDTHHLAADTSDAFVSACFRLVNDPTLRHELAANAHAFVSTRHSAAALDRALS